jgi:8-amino-7-oxononanoate synthase
MDETAERSNHETYSRALEALSRRGRLRKLAPRAGLDFASNDYLGLAHSTELTEAARAALARGVPVGAGGSRLLRGNHPEHEALEAEAKAHFCSDAALFLGGGFLANYAIFSTLPQRGDLVVYDALIHASVHDGVRAGRAEAVAARHNDAESFEAAIRSWRAKGGTGRAWIAVESLYSMDGDRAPLADLAHIAERHDAMLVIDEAHATGVLGPDGRGLGADLEGRENVVALHTCGKGLGVAGALVTLPAVLAEFLVNRCRPFIYATAPSPLDAALVRAALAIVRDQPERRQRLARRVETVGNALRVRTGLAQSGSHILPIVVGSDARAVALADTMQARGFDVRAIRPPTVPEGTARLRLALTLNVEEADALRLVDALAVALTRLPP